MKNRILYFLITCLLSLFVVSCDSSSKEVVSDIEETKQGFVEQTLSLPKESTSNVDMLKQYESLMIQVLKMSREKEFRDLVFDKTLLQESGDYDVLIDKLANNNFKSSNLSKSISTLKTLSKSITNKNSDGLRPMVFYPKAETYHEKLAKNKGYNMKSVKSEIKEPVVVFRGPHANDYSVPGYRLSTENKLVFDRMVTEEDAWQNDVYVVGPEENVGYVMDPCMEQLQKNDHISLPCDDWGGTGGGGGSTSSNLRKDGRTEKGGLIQVVTNLNEIEHWVNGKLEFRIVIAGLKNNSGTIIKDLPLPKRRRRNFKKRKWYNYDLTLFNWNKSLLGDYNVEKWIERDGGSSTTISLSIKPKDAPAVSLSVTVKSEDQDLGQSIVQFTDPLSTVYGLGMVNFKRK